jgi:hypothetical protein
MYEHLTTTMGLRQQLHSIASVVLMLLKIFKKKKAEVLTYEDEDDDDDASAGDVDSSGSVLDGVEDSCSITRLVCMMHECLKLTVFKLTIDLLAFFRIFFFLLVTFATAPALNACQNMSVCQMHKEKCHH